MSDSVAVVWDDALLGYTMGGDHPLHPVRLDLTMRLADTPRRARRRPAAGGAADPGRRRAAHPRARPRLPGGGQARARRTPASATAWAPPDNPIFEGMYDAAALITGGSVLAARRCTRAASSTRSTSPAACTTRCATPPPASASSTTPPSRSPGCSRQGYERIAYVDLDVHHGDGVQAAFYDDPRVLTVSIHQTPLTLFPGTGFPEETGDAGEGPGQRGEPRAAQRHRRLRLAARVHRRRPQRRCGRSGRRSWSPSAAATPTTRTRWPTSRSPSTASAPATGPCTTSPTRSATAAGSCSAAAATGWCAACPGPGRTCSPRSAATGSTRRTEIPQSWRDDVVRRGLRARPPTHMTEGGYTGFSALGPVHRVPRRPGDHAHPAGRPSPTSDWTRTTPVTDARPRSRPPRPRRRRRTGRPTSSPPTAARCTCARSAPRTPTASSG